MNNETSAETVCEQELTIGQAQRQQIQLLLNQDKKQIHQALVKPEKFTEVMKNGKNSVLYKTTLKYIVKQNINNWQLNRPVDNVRVPDIAKDIYDLQQVFGIIYLVYNRTTSMFECYDGIHRFEAMKYLYSLQECRKDVKNIGVLVDISVHNDEAYIINKFTTINKCVPIPELFVKNDTKIDLRTKVIEIVEYFIHKYPKMFKSSSRPNVPHENRDRFIDKITDILTEFELDGESAEMVIQLILNYNLFVKNMLNGNDKLHNKKITITQKIKCNENDMYVFWNKNWDIHFKKCFHDGVISLV